MTNFTHKDIGFLSNPELVDILRSLLDEIDVVASAGAHRSTTYLAVSAIEGIFGEILKLRGIDATTTTVQKHWPKNSKGSPKKLDELTLANKEAILKAAGALPKVFDDLYTRARQFRNYIHPARELKDQTPIDLSVEQLALACLNALIEDYSPQRFFAGQEWRLMSGLTRVLTDNTISMPQDPGDPVSLLVSELPAERFREVIFRVKITPNAIFNFVYNFASLDQWMAARIEGRIGPDNKGFDNGKVFCAEWRGWNMVGRYTDNSEPSPREPQHTMRVALDPPGTFDLTVDGRALTLKDGVSWDFDRHGKIGFMTEQGPVSVVDLEVKAR